MARKHRDSLALPVPLDVFLARLGTPQEGVVGRRQLALVNHRVLGREVDLTLQAHGYRVLRFTWRQVLHETLLVTVRIAQLLTRTPHHALPTPPAGG